MTESEANARFTVAFVNSLQAEDVGRYTVSKPDADRLTSLQTGKPIAAVKGNLWMEVTHFSNTVNDGILYARKAEDFARCIVTGKQIGRAHV